MRVWRAAVMAVMAGAVWGVVTGAASEVPMTSPAESQPAATRAATAAAAPEKNLVKAEGVMLSKTAKTEEEEEEQVGLSRGGNYSMNSMGGVTTMDAVGSPEEILKYVNGYRPAVVRGVTLPGNQFHMHVTGKNPREVMQKLFAAYAEAFKVKVDDTPREVDAFNMEADAKVLKTLPRPKGGAEYSVSEDAPTATGFKVTVEGSLKQIADVIGEKLGMPVTDESHLLAAYRIELQWTKANPLESMKQSLAGRGLKLMPGKKKVTGIFVGPLEAATGPASTQTK